MKLKHPNSCVNFEVTPAYFLGGFDVYDREETLEAHLNSFDPNNKRELKQLINERFFNLKKTSDLTVDHKTVLFRVVVDSLKDSEYDFDSLFLDDDDSCFYMPSEWKFERARLFFEVLYESMIDNWGDDIRNINGISPPPDTLK